MVRPCSPGTGWSSGDPPASGSPRVAGENIVVAKDKRGWAEGDIMLQTRRVPVHLLYSSLSFFVLEMLLFGALVEDGFA